jgi:uncharacterized protein
MATAWKQFTIASVLFGKTQRGLLSLFFAKPAESFNLSDIVRIAQIGLGTAQRELALWTEAGLLTRTTRGNQVYYRANPACPVYSELRSLAVKTIGVANILRDSLTKFSDEIVVAFVQGSVARQLQELESDVDLIVIGNVEPREVVLALNGSLSTIGQDVKTIVYTAKDFRTKLRAKHPFVKWLLESPKVFLIGDEVELQRLGMASNP